MEKHLLSYLSKYNQETNKVNIDRLKEISKLEISTIDNNDIDYDDMLTYLYSTLSHPDHTITKSQEIAEFNRFIEHGIHHIINNTFSIDTTLENLRDITVMDKLVKAINIKFIFLDTHIESPRQIDRNGHEVPKNPDDYRVNNDSYMSDIILTLKITLTAIKHNGTEEIKEGYVNRIKISAIPIMVGSSMCNTHGMSKDMKDGINEDSDDPGGYFIIGGKEYVIMSVESSVFNKARYMKSTLKTERVRASILSQVQGGPYEPSMQLIIKYLTDGCITCDIQTIKINKAKIPFFLIFRMYGVSSDKDIMRLILHDLNKHTEVSDKLLELVSKAFGVKYPDYEKYKSDNDMVNNLQFMLEGITQAADKFAYKTDPEAIKFAIEDILKKLDENLLPHIGRTASVRYNKLCLIGTLIRDSILVDLDLKQEDDRDTMVNKRAHGAGISLAKTFKKLFNAKVVTPIRNTLQDDVRTKSFDTINVADLGITIRNSIAGEELKTSFEKYVNASEKESVRQKESIKMTAQPLERKNMLNVCLTLRTVVASISKVAKTTSRADKIRYWHPTAAGIYCPASTPESGEKVGTIKQAALTMIISRAKDGLSLVMKNMIKDEPSFIDINGIEPEIIPQKGLSKIFVDGDWIGCCETPYTFVKKYRIMRREGLVDRYFSITWNSVDNEIWIYTDFGRMMRPLLIVDNNLDDIISKKTDKFVQNIRLTKEIINNLKLKKISFEDLIVTGYVEYIFPGEEVLVCPSSKRLKETKNDITSQWTHCDVEQALFGLSALVGPFLEHNGQGRNTLVSIHARQSCGQPMKNIHTATLRQLRFHQHRVDNPLVKTIIQQFLPPNCQTLMVLYTVMLGYNMEDSSIMNRASVDSGALKGTFFKMEFVDIEKNFILKIPKESETSLYKKHMSYSKLDDGGCVPVGTLISKGDILLGIVIEVSKPSADGKMYVDKSFQYSGEETGRVVSITKKTDGNKKFYRFTFEYERAMIVGDKSSSRAGNKNIIALLMPPQDMPYTEKGERPDLVLNPHSIPSRMTPAQLFETAISKLCAKKGMFVDGTVYRKYNVYELFTELEKEGLALKEVMINGMTGEAYDSLMFYGPQTIFRLPKFVMEDRHAVGRSGPLDPITSQAVTGKRMHGGHKVGEMELWVYMTQGAMSSFHEEFYLDSDYRKIYICRGCNELATYNASISRYKCRICKDNVDICSIDSCKTTMLVIQELMSANIKLKTIPEKRKYEKFL